MKVTLIYPDISPVTQTFMHGIGYLSAVLKNGGHQVELFHVKAMPEREKFVSEIMETQPDIIGFSATSNMINLVNEWSRWLKECIDIPIICGGKHATLSPNETLNNPYIDMVCVGEGEYAFLELCDHLMQDRDILNIANIWVKNNNKIFKNEVRSLVDNLDNLPFPDRTVFDYHNLTCSRNGVGLFMASRGCPYDCNYCCNQSLRQIYDHNGRYVRFRSVDNLLREMRHVINTYPFIKTVAFDDDIVPLYKDWFREFIAKYKEEINMPFYMNVRPNLVDEEVADLLKEADCQQIRFGLESGNEHISNKILNRKLTNEQIRWAFRLCRDRKIRTLSYNMVGIPFEDKQCILDTIKLNAAIGTNDFAVSIFYPYQKTKLYDICAEKGMLTGKVANSYFQECTINHDKLSKEEIEFAKQYFVIFARLHRINSRLWKFISKPLEKYLDKLFLAGPYKYKITNGLIYKAFYIKNYVKGVPLIYPFLRELKKRLKKLR